MERTAAVESIKVAQVLQNRCQEQIEAGFLVCDSLGRVLLCSPAAAELYGGNPDDVERLSLDVLLLDSAHSDIAPSYLSRNLAYLSERVGWRRFNAMSDDGRVFPVALSIKKFQVDHVPLFMVRLRHLNDA